MFFGPFLGPSSVPLQSSRRVGVPLALSEMGGAKKERVEKFWSVTSVEQLLTKLDLAKYVTTFNEEVSKACAIFHVT